MLDSQNILRKINNNNQLQLSLYFPSPFNYSFSATSRLSIILSNEENFEWFYTNFWQLMFNKKLLDNPNKDSHALEIFPLNIYLSGKTTTGIFLSETTLNSNIIDLNYNNVIDKHIEWLKNEYYIFSHIEATKLKGCKYYNPDIHRVHTVFIIGYNLKNETFKILDFDSRGNFLLRDISFQNYLDAFFSKYVPQLLQKKAYGPNYNVVLCKPKETLNKCTLDLNHIIIEITDFINSYPTDYRYNNFIQTTNANWGMDVYSSLKQYVALCYEFKTCLQFTSFHALYEYINWIVFKMSFIYSRYQLMMSDNLKSDINNIVDYVTQLRQLAFKQSLVPKLTNVTQLQNLIDKIQILHIKIFKNILYTFMSVS